MKDKLGHGYSEDEGLLGVKWHSLYLRDMRTWGSATPWEGMRLSANERQRWPTTEHQGIAMSQYGLLLFLASIARVINLHHLNNF